MEVPKKRAEEATSVEEYVLNSYPVCALNVDGCTSHRHSLLQCGVPKKGHVCPYQPKLKRRPDEPPPEMRNAAVQVEMDEVRLQRQGRSGIMARILTTCL